MSTEDPPGLAALLGDVERDHDCTVLAARDVGSRAWNLAGPDSDYDVAVVFAQDPVEYATIGDTVDSVERTHGPVELRGWNVSRFAALLTDSNPTVIEFLNSPLRYRECPELRALEADIAGAFVPIALYHHYRSLARSNYRKYLERRLLDGGDPAFVVREETAGAYLADPLDDDAVPAPDPDGPRRIPKDADYEPGATDRTVKRNLYVVRAVLSAEYVRTTHSFPPLDFPAFLDELDERSPSWLAPSILDRARDLAERKRRGEGDCEVGSVFDREELLLDDHVDPGEHNVRGIDPGRVDAFTRTVLREYRACPDG